MSTKTRTEKSADQVERERARDGSGKFVKNPCDLCGKGAPMSSYFSDDRVNGCGHGWGLVLHARCATFLSKLSDDEYEALARFAESLRARPL